MFARAFHLLVVLLCVVALVACEGEQGPAGPAGPAGQDGQDGEDGEDGAPGPSYILAYGSCHQLGSIITSGPAGITAAITKNGVGDYTVTVTGTFPSTEGTLIVSTSSTYTMLDQFVTGQIISWSTTEIAFDVYAWDLSLGALDDEDFSFVILE